MSLGVRESTEKAVRAGLTFIQFTVRPEEDAAAIDEYLKALPPTPSPRLRDGQLSASARRGARVFERAGCNICHPGPLFTDMQRYDVGTGRGLDAGKAMDTPTLVEAWRTAPYLHDGSAATMREVLTTANRNDRHGKTSHLTDRQIQDLVAFLLSL
jgi:cytochrome c peroxidase